MRNVNASAYVRVPFSAVDPGDFDACRLKMKYDDGFVAYLNGVEVARRNAPAAPALNSRRRAARTAAALVVETISITAAEGRPADGATTCWRSTGSTSPPATTTS